MSRLISVSGSHADIGFGIGSQCRDAIGQSLALVSDEVTRFTSLDQARAKAEKYIPHIQSSAPHLVDELQGLADGAGITVADALLLQLRFEIVGFDGRGGEGCSSFAANQNGHRVTGQNVDAPAAHKALGMMLKIKPDSGPAMLMYNYYAGMIGYIGINSRGLSVFGNALLAPGWRIGFPRYLLMRLALEQSSVAEVERVVGGLYRASTINLMLSDAAGRISDMELAVDDMAVLRPDGDRLFHSNHYLSASLRPQECLLPLLPDSAERYRCGRALIDKVDFSRRGGELIEEVKTLLSDHSHYPTSICRHRAAVSRYDADQWESVASIIAEPDAGCMHVCFGNPCELEYESYYLN